MSDSFPITERTTMRRVPERGEYDRDTVYAILDEALVCHVGFITDAGPVVIPTIHARDGHVLYLHGSVASRMQRTLRDGADVCITVTLVDGLVLARSVFHHSMNYRSVMVFGTATEITDPDQKEHAMEALVERLVPGRWDDSRHPNEKETRATMMLQVPLEEASAKIRTGPPGDDDEDYGLDVWAGVIPVTTVFGEAEPDPVLAPGIEPPGYVTDYSRP